MPRLKKAIYVCLRNQLVALAVSVPFYYMMKYRGMAFTADQLPTFQWVLVELFVFMLVEEFGFYYSHR